MNEYRKEIINFYNEEATRYKNERNKIIGFEDVYKPFTDLLKPNAKILDFGCGSGRDSLYFKENGFNVTALDGSKEMCKITKELCNIEVKEMYFEDFKENCIYDGIWACASLLHLPKAEMVKVLKNLFDSLKENGYIYCSFKYGDFEGVRSQRYFLDMTEEKIQDIINEIPSAKIVNIFHTEGLLKDQKNKHWLHIILKKEK